MASDGLSRSLYALGPARRVPLFRFEIFDEVDPLVLHRAAYFDVAGPIATQARLGEPGEAHIQVGGRQLGRVEFFGINGPGSGHRRRGSGRADAGQECGRHLRSPS